MSNCSGMADRAVCLLRAAVLIRQLLWVLPFYGAFTLAMHAGYAVYFPELFPARLRALGLERLLQRRPDCRRRDAAVSGHVKSCWRVAPAAGAVALVADLFAGTGRDRLHARNQGPAASRGRSAVAADGVNRSYAQGAEKTASRSDLESAMVRLVRARGGISRVELARTLKLVPSTAGIYVDRLLAEGYLLETAARPVGWGGRRSLLQLNPRAGRFVGVDFDARQIFATAVDFAQQPLEEVRRTIPARARSIACWRSSPKRSREVAGTRPRDLLGIGLGVPGPVDAARGVSLRYAFLQGLARGADRSADGRAVSACPSRSKTISARSPWPNCGTARAAACATFVCLGVRSGIGSGIIVDGQLLRGANNLAGEIGRWICPDAAIRRRPAVAGQTIEDVASLSALLKGAGAAHAGRICWSALERRQRQAVAVVQRAARVHAWVVHQLATLFGSRAAGRGRSVGRAGIYLAALMAAAAEFGGAALAEKLTPSTLGPYAGATRSGGPGLSTLETATMTAIPAVRLASGAALPAVGLGFWKIDRAGRGRPGRRGRRASAIGTSTAPATTATRPKSAPAWPGPSSAASAAATSCGSPRNCGTPIIAASMSGRRSSGACGI